jgi:hypothetical protein
MMLKYMYKFQSLCLRDGLSQEAVLAKAKEVFGNDVDLTWVTGRYIYKPDLHVVGGKEEVDRLIEDIRLVRKWHVADALDAHMSRFGDDREFEEPPAHVFRMSRRTGELPYFAGEAGVGHRLNLVLNNKGRCGQWGSTDDQWKKLTDAMGYEAHVEWWKFPKSQGDLFTKEEHRGATSSNDFEVCVLRAWWWRRNYVGNKYAEWIKEGRKGEFPEPLPRRPDPKTEMKAGNGDHTTVGIFMKKKQDGLLTDEQTTRLARALGGSDNFEWWK